jgi:hypothetical protein
MYRSVVYDNLSHQEEDTKGYLDTKGYQWMQQMLNEFGGIQ